MAIKQLVHVLNKLNEVHALLLESGEQKKQALIRNDVASLNQLVHNENKLIKQVSQLEQQRAVVTNDFLLSKGYKLNDRITVTEIAKLIFNAEEKGILLEAQERLVNTLHQLKQLNEANQELVKQSLAFVEFSIDVMSGSEEDWSYQHPDQTASKIQRSGLFDTRA
ncbi:FlgN protein [Chlamydia abortus]|nr:FlgN protein [Chlamydia abortus]